MGLIAQLHYFECNIWLNVGTVKIGSQILVWNFGICQEELVHARLAQMLCNVHGFQSASLPWCIVCFINECISKSLLYVKKANIYSAFSVVLIWFCVIWSWLGKQTYACSVPLFLWSRMIVIEYTRWFKYDRDWLRLVYTQISPGHIWITL
jgi:hypothetical protein